MAYAPYKPFNQQEKESILKFHNDYRSDLAAGSLASFNLPAASDMNVLSWDKECEFTATCWVMQCTWSHDTDRKSLDDTLLGQNLYTQTTTDARALITAEEIKTANSGWWKEYKVMNGSAYATVYSSFKSVSGPAIGHFTQMAWAKTKYVGCGYFTTYRQNNTAFPGKASVTMDVYCNYREGGNMKEAPMYQEGKAATACEGGVIADAPYTNLCGKIRKMKDDKFEMPGVKSSVSSIFYVSSIVILDGLCVFYNVYLSLM